MFYLRIFFLGSTFRGQQWKKAQPFNYSFMEIWTEKPPAHIPTKPAATTTPLGFVFGVYTYGVYLWGHGEKASAFLL